MYFFDKQNLTTRVCCDLNIVFSGAKKKKKKILFGVPILQFLLPP
jgi:hypothetical protein